MELPEHSGQSAKIIVERLLVSMGYPKDIVKLNISEISQESSKTQSSVQMGEFNLQNGKLTFNSQALKTVDTPELVAILAHELDHFDKALKTAKAVGVNKYIAMFPKHSPSDAIFWNNNIQYANITNFDSQKYYNAIYRLVNPYDGDLISSYSDFFRFSEPARNPVEVSGYAVSDKVLSYYYGKPQPKSDLRKLADLFDKTDKVIRQKAQTKSYLRNCTSALFDYYYRQAGLIVFPALKPMYDDCAKTGDLSTFWLKMEGLISDFYKKGQMSKATLDNVYRLLTKTYELSSASGLTNSQINEIFVQKIMTISSNIYSQKAQKYMESLINDYLTFLTQTQTQTPKDELRVLIAGVCADNSVYKDNKDKIVSISNLNIRPLYKQRIYSNSEFIVQSGQYKNKEECLVSIVKQSALKRRVN